MSRKRYISTDISTDVKLAELAEYGTLPLLLYTWAIPHMDDWGRMTGDARQFKLLVCPALDVTTKEVDEALDQIDSVGLWQRYDAEGKKCIAIPEGSWFKHQSYIAKAKRGDDSCSNYPSPDNHRKTPQNTEEHQPTPQNTVSFSSSFSPSNTATASNAREDDIGTEEEETNDEPEYESFYTAHKRIFGFNCNEFQAEELAAYIDKDGMEETVVIRAIERAALNGTGYSFGLITKILNDYLASGAKTLSEAIAFDDEYEKRRKRRNNYAKPRGSPARDGIDYDALSL